MDYYNKDRYQWDLEKLSPREYYCYRQTGVQPHFTINLYKMVNIGYNKMSN